MKASGIWVYCAYSASLQLLCKKKILKSIILTLLKMLYKAKCLIINTEYL